MHKFIFPPTQPSFDPIRKINTTFKLYWKTGYTHWFVVWSFVHIFLFQKSFSKSKIVHNLWFSKMSKPLHIPRPDPDIDQDLRLRRIQLLNQLRDLLLDYYRLLHGVSHWLRFHIFLRILFLSLFFTFPHHELFTARKKLQHPKRHKPNPAAKPFTWCWKLVLACR